MSHYYATLNANNQVIGVSELNSKITQDNLIELDSYDISLMGQKYDFETKKFIFEIPDVSSALRIETKPVEPTQLDRIEILLNKNNDQISKKTIDEYTLKIIKNESNKIFINSLTRLYTNPSYPEINEELLVKLVEEGKITEVDKIMIMAGVSNQQ